MLGLWLGESEGAKFWLSVPDRSEEPRAARHLRGLHRRPVAALPRRSTRPIPQTKVQLCIVHLVRAALRYVSTQDSKAVIADLKKIYQAATVLEAEQALENFAQAWDAKYPTIARCGVRSGPTSSRCSIFRRAIRKAIYTTNAIESVNSVIRKFTRNRKIYPNEESALKIVYMAIREASKKWTMPIRHWKEALNHFAILFEGPHARVN